MNIDRASRDGSRDVNRPIILLAILYISVIGPAVFIVQPGFVHGLVAGYGFNDQQAGYIASAEMWGIAVTTLVMGFVLHRFNWRAMMALAALVIAAANFLHGTIAPLQQSLPLSLIVRGLAGLGSGVFVSLSFTLIGLKFGRIIPTAGAVAGSIVSLVFLLGPFSSLAFAVAAGAYCFFWNFMHPLLLSFLSKIDKTGGILAHGIAAQMLGTAAGPALAALIVAQNDYSHVLWLGIGLYALTLVMVLPLLVRLHRHGRKQGL
ncbi:hypothetical protein [Sphingobium cloacae]|nr:hypothetical protein [Sphingobium cloacae]